MRMTRSLAIALETVGCCITLAGIVTEWATGADYGYAIITGGALVVTFGSMIFAKCIRGRWRDENKD
jgi:hypothetical protein